MSKKEQGLRLYQAIERLCMQAGTDPDETVDWLCGQHGGMSKLFQSYFSPKEPNGEPLENQLANQAETSGSLVQQEPFGHVAVRRLSQRFESHADQYWFYPAGESPYRDNVDEIHAVYTSPPASKPVQYPENFIDALRFDMALREYAQSQKRPQNCGTGYCSCIECVMGKAGA